MFDQLPIRLRDNLKKCSEETIVLDNIKVGKLIRLATSLGPKFMFPEVGSSEEDKTGLLRAATQA